MFYNWESSRGPQEKLSRAACRPGGSGGHLEYLVSLWLSERRYPKQNTVVSLKQKFCPPPKFLRWLPPLRASEPRGSPAAERFVLPLFVLRRCRRLREARAAAFPADRRQWRLRRVGPENEASKSVQQARLRGNSKSCDSAIFQSVTVVIQQFFSQQQS